MDLTVEAAKDNMDEELQHAVQDRNWQAVGELLQRGGVSDELCRLALEEACKEADAHVLTEFILPYTLHCQQGPSLSYLLKRHMWHVLENVLQRGKNSVAEKRLVVEKASRFADDINFLVYMFPHCVEDQQQCVFRTLVSRSLWQSVSAFMQKGVSDELVHLAVEEASKRADEKDFENYLLPHCTGALLSIALNEMQERHLDHCCQAILDKTEDYNRHGSSTEENATEETKQQTNEVSIFVGHLQDHIGQCPATNSLSETIGHLLPHNSAAGAALAAAFAEALAAAKEEEKEEEIDKNQYQILKTDATEDSASSATERTVNNPGTQEDHLKKWIRDSVKHRNKQRIAELFQQDGVRDDLLVYVLEEALREDIDLFLFIFPFCSPHVKASFWSNVVKQTQCHVTVFDLEDGQISEEQVQSLLADFSEHMPTDILGDHVQQALTTLVKATQQTVQESSGVPISKHDHFGHSGSYVTEQPLLTQSEELLISLKSQNAVCAVDNSETCTDHKQLQNLEKQVTQDGQHTVSDIPAISQQPTCENPAPADDVKVAVITSEENNSIVVDTLGKEANDAIKQQTQIKREFPEKLGQEEDLNSIIRDAVEKKNWQVVRELLQKDGVSDEVCMIAFDEICGEDPTLIKSIFPLSLSHQRTLFLYLITQELWFVIGYVLDQCQVSEEQTLFVIDKACELADDLNFLTYIFSHCPEDQTQSVFIKLVARGLWQSVSELLNKGVTEELVILAVEESSAQATEVDFIENILPHCTGPLLSIALENLSKRDLMKGTEAVLKKISGKSRRGITAHGLEQQTLLSSGSNGKVKDTEARQSKSDFAQAVKNKDWDAIKVLQQNVDRDVFDEDVWYENRSNRLYKANLPQNKSSAESTGYPDASQKTPSLLVTASSQLIQARKSQDRDSTGIYQLNGKDKYNSTVSREVTLDGSRYENSSETCGNPTDDEEFNLGRDKSIDQQDHSEQVQNDTDSSCTVTSKTRMFCKNEIEDIEKAITDKFLQAIRVLACKKHIVSATIRLVLSVPFLDLLADESLGLLNLYDALFEKAGDDDAVSTQLVNIGSTLARSLAQDKRVDPLFTEFCEQLIPVLNDKEFRSFFEEWPEIEDDENEEVLMSCAFNSMRNLLEDKIGLHFTDTMWSRYTKLIEDISDDDAAENLMVQVWDCIENQQYSALKEFITPDRVYAFGEGFFQLCFETRQGEEDQQAKQTSENNAGTLAKLVPKLQDDDLLAPELQKLMREGRWHEVAQILQMGVGPDLHRWIVLEASKRADGRTLVKSILPSCPDDQLECVLHNLREKGKWLVAAHVLKRGVREEVHRQTVNEAVQKAPAFVLHMLLYSGKDSLIFYDQMDGILSHLVERNLWQLVSLLLTHCKVSKETSLWAIAEAMERAEDECLVDLIEQLFPGNETNIVLERLVNQKRWNFIDSVIKQGATGGSKKKAIEMACEHADEEVLLKHVLHYCEDEQLEDVLKQMETRHFKEATGMVMQRILSNFLSLLVNLEEPASGKYQHYWDTIRERIPTLIGIARKRLLYTVQHLSDSTDLDITVSELLSVSFVQFICCEFSSELNLHNILSDREEAVFVEFMKIGQAVIASTINYTVFERKEKDSEEEMRQKVKCWRGELVHAHQSASVTTKSQMKHFFHFFWHYFQKRRRRANDISIVAALAIVPLIPTVQNVALRIMMHEGRWDVISIADLSYVWENVRREMFQRAVKERRWKIVEQWTDHGLYDDLRAWAIKEAYEEGQWNVFMQLADYGVEDADLKRIHYRLAKYADWGTVCELMERGGDATELKELLDAAKTSRNRESQRRRADAVKNHSLWLQDLEKEVQCVSLNTAIKEFRWITVLFQLRNGLRAEGRKKIQRDHVSKGNTTTAARIKYREGRRRLPALHEAVKHEAWYVVMEIVRLGINDSQRDRFFLEMIKRRQWGVCRVLLEKRVSTELQLAALPELQRMNQWVLISRMMEYDHGDSVIRKVMKCALERREGSVVWHCMSLLHTPLTLEERNDLFHKALALEIWQAVKPLTEVKDITGKEHRDIALLEAIEHGQWDVLDHCQRHYGDINKQHASGETGLQRAARKEDWKAVEELIWRGADQFVPDSDGYTALHRAVNADQWDIVTLLVKFHGDLNKCDNCITKPIQSIIDNYKSDIIDEALFWGQNINNAVNRVLETPLHAACAVGDFETMYYLVARGLDPLAVTVKRQSVLMYAVMNQGNPWKMVVECIKLGVSTHQPKITDKKVLMMTNPWYKAASRQWKSGIVSPFEYSILHGLPVISRILYESGSCSNKELFRLNEELPTKLSSSRDEFQSIGAEETEERIDDVCENVLNFLHFVRTKATTPRTLMSTCRLVISHSLKIGHRRHRLVQKLPLSRFMKDYVMFSDLMDPNYC